MKTHNETRKRLGGGGDRQGCQSKSQQIEGVRLDN